MMEEAKVVFEDETTLISAISRREGAPRSALLSFTGVGHKTGVLDIQQPEFAGAGRDVDCMLFISDKTRSWGNRLNVPALQRVIAEHAPNAQLDTLGNSMGGFLALLAPTFLPVSTAIAFAPQFSVRPDIVPFERRWTDYRRAISEWPYPSLATVWQDRTRYYVFTGRQGPDAAHADLTVAVDNLAR